jgi:hypothetical protein
MFISSFIKICSLTNSCNFICEICMVTCYKGMLYELISHLPRQILWNCKCTIICDGPCFRFTTHSMKKSDFTSNTGGVAMGHAKRDHLTLAW